MIRNAKCTLSAVAVIAAIASTSLWAAPPSNFTYQGQIKQRDVPVNDELAIMFTLWDSLDRGREVAPGLETRVKVVNGLFTADLDFGLEPFTGEPRWLEITLMVGDGRVTLTPRQLLSSIPVALFALAGNEGPPGPEGPAGSSDLVLPFSGTNTTDDVALSILQTGLLSTASFGIDNTANTQPALSLLTNGTGPGLLSISASGAAIRGLTGPAGGVAGYFVTQGVVNTQPALFAQNQAMGSAAHVKVAKRENTAPALLTETYGDGPAAHFKTHPDLNNVNLAPTILSETEQYGPAGYFRIRNDQSSATALSVDTNGPGLSFEAKTTGAGSGAKIEIANAASTGHALEAITDGTGHAGLFVVTNTQSTNPTLKAESRGDNAAIHAEAVGQGTGLFTRASLGADALVAVANGFGQAASFLSTDLTNEANAVEIRSMGKNAALKVTNANGLSLEAASFVGSIRVARTDGVLANSFHLWPSSGGGQLRMYDSNGSRTITLDAEYGGVGRITTDEILITGGSDLSEGFDVQVDEAEVEPGTVLCIDKKHPGKLSICGRAYDKTVAGIVSGAGGVRTGMMMGQKGSLADGAYPVALSGRVYCKVDTSNGAIEPGDLLTTSKIPGFAMKVSESDHASGAIIGKAMTGLGKGQGLVLVLVSLQ